MLLVLVLVAALAAGGWYGYDRWIRDDTSSVRTAPAPCRTRAHPPPPAALSAVRLQVVNATKRVGLAHEVARKLHRRGATVRKVGNAKRRVKGTIIRHSTDATSTAAALAVREQVAGPAMLAGAAGSPVVLVIGPDFKGLATPAEADAARRKDVTAASPSPPACAAS